MTIQLIEVTTTCESRSLAQKIAAQLIQHKLAACVQIAGPIESHFRWEGRIETSQEWKCVCKTTLPRYEQVQSMIQSLHTYDVPEIIATNVVRVSADYLAWADAELMDKS